MLMWHQSVFNTPKLFRGREAPTLNSPRSLLYMVWSTFVLYALKFLIVGQGPTTFLVEPGEGSDEHKAKQAREGKATLF